MAKDRFKTRRSWDSKFKYGSLYEKPLPKRTITEQQTNIMNDMLQSGKLSEWEFDFVRNCKKFYTLSQKQKDILNKIYKKAYTGVAI